MERQGLKQHQRELIMPNPTPKDAQKGGQGAIGKNKAGTVAGRERNQRARRGKTTGYDKDQRPGQKP